jgi:hypothetical protein
MHRPCHARNRPKSAADAGDRQGVAGAPEAIARQNLPPGGKPRRRGGFAAGRLNQILTVPIYFLPHAEHGADG